MFPKEGVRKLPSKSLNASWKNTRIQDAYCTHAYKYEKFETNQEYVRKKKLRKQQSKQANCINAPNCGGE